MVLPLVVGVVALVSDVETAASVGYAIAIILVNFLLSAYLLVWAARISLGLVASVALGGYVMRLALVFLAVWLIRDTAWVRMIPLGITIIVTHLGLLTWELRHVAATVAHPGLKPEVGGGHGRRAQPAAGYRPDRFRSGKNQP
ncbi:MAG: ATP synthase subunit I [Actinomycetota bacterium]